MIKAIIFDFDGVIVDTEPIHLRAFKKILRNEGIELDDALYYSKYLAYDDKTFFRQSMIDFGITKTGSEIDDLVKKKSEIIEDLLEDDLELFPGVLQFIQKSAKNYQLAIGSGALRKEIEFILEKFKINDIFRLIVSANEVQKCKPDPEVYLKVLELLNKSDQSNFITPGECLVIEDSVYGIRAAKKAGMVCAAITNSYEKDKLDDADIVLDNILELKPEDMNVF